MAHDGHVYAYNFTGKRYDTGNKLGYLKATVEFALRREDLGEDFKNYLKNTGRKHGLRTRRFDRCLLLSLHTPKNEAVKK